MVEGGGEEKNQVYWKCISGGLNEIYIHSFYTTSNELKNELVILSLSIVINISQPDYV